MTGKVFDFAGLRERKAREREQVSEASEAEKPHVSGNAFCMQCLHHWVAVAPVGTIDMECPECHSMRGHWRFNVAPPEPQVYQCNCGNQFFHVTPSGVFCPGCGIYHTF